MYWQVQGKVNAITLDSCSRTGLVFEDIVSSCEVVNCSSVEVQSTGVMPTIAVDKTDGIVVSCKSDHESSLTLAPILSPPPPAVPGPSDSDDSYMSTCVRHNSHCTSTSYSGELEMRVDM